MTDPQDLGVESLDPTGGGGPPRMPAEAIAIILVTLALEAWPKTP